MGPSDEAREAGKEGQAALTKRSPMRLMPRRV